MRLKSVLISLFLIVLVIGLSGCSKAPVQGPTPEQKAADEAAKKAADDAAKAAAEAAAKTAQEEAAKKAAEETAAKEQLKNAQASSNGFCGDGICQNVEHLYPNSKVACAYQDCTIEGKYTENNYNCPNDCGTVCTEDTTIGLKPGTCKVLSNGDIEFTIVNSGYKQIDGFLFYVAEKPIAIEGQIGYDSSEKGLDTKQVSDKNTQYDITLRTSGLYTVDVSAWKEKFGTVDHIEIMPRIIDGGQTKECSNQKVLLPLRSCK